MIAGLLQSQNDITTQRIPGLGRVPVLGALFSSKAYQRRETDLVIIITPFLVKPMDPTKKPLTPLDRTQSASTADYFLGDVEETKPGHDRRASPSPARCSACADIRTLPRPAEGLRHG